MLKSMYYIAIPLMLLFCNSLSFKSSSSLSYFNTESPKEQPELGAVNNLLTIYAQTFNPNFKQGELSDEILINFGIYYNYLHWDKAFKQEDNNKVSISKKMVADSAYNYLGFKIKEHKAIQGVEMRKNKYMIDQASGEMQTFVQVDSVLSYNSNELYVSAKVYTASSGWSGNINGTPADWAKNSEQDGEIPELSERIKAKLKLESSTTKKHWILLEYVR